MLYSFLHNDVTFILKIWLKIYFSRLYMEHRKGIWQELGFKAPLRLKHLGVCLMACGPGSPRSLAEGAHLSLGQTTGGRAAQA